MKTHRDTFFNYLKLNLLLFSVLLFFAGTAQNNIEDELVFDDWDRNNDGLISQTEFVEQFNDEEFTARWQAHTKAATMDRNTTQELRYGGQDDQQFDAVEYGNIGEDGELTEAERDVYMDDTTTTIPDTTEAWGDAEDIGENDNNDHIDSYGTADIEKDKSSATDTSENFEWRDKEYGDRFDTDQALIGTEKDTINPDTIYTSYSDEQGNIEYYTGSDTTITDTSKTEEWGDVENVDDYDTDNENLYNNSEITDTTETKEWGDTGTMDEGRFDNDSDKDNTIVSDRFNEAQEEDKFEENPNRFGDKGDMKEYDRTNNTNKVGIDRSEYDDNQQKNMMHKDKSGKKVSDMTSDAGIENADYYVTVFGVWDKNRDYRLDESEWNKGCEKAEIKDDVKKDYSSLDTNKDNYIDYNEFSSAMRETNYYSEYDVNQDRKIDKDELGQMVFDTWDFDQSDYIEEDEYQQFVGYYKNF